MSPKVIALGVAESVAGPLRPTQPEIRAAKVVAKNAKGDVDRQRKR